MLSWVRTWTQRQKLSWCGSNMGSITFAREFRQCLARRLEHTLNYGHLLANTDSVSYVDLNMADIKWSRSAGTTNYPVATAFFPFARLYHRL
jgi:hypothetical protein